jgi:chromosome segregation ATPase
MNIVNDNDGKGNDSNDDNFEEINESREIIEDRINRIKLQIIDFTVKQQEISEKVLSLTKDN